MRGEGRGCWQSDKAPDKNRADKMVRSQIYKAQSCLKGKNILGRKVGAVVKALASHWCDVICHSVEALCGLSMFWVLILVLRGFSQGRDGSRGGARPPVIFGSNWGPKGGNIFGGRPPSHALSKGLDDHPPPPPLISRSGSGTDRYSGFKHAILKKQQSNFWFGK